MSPTIKFAIASAGVGFLHIVGGFFLAIAKVAAVTSGLIYVTLTDWADQLERWGGRDDLQNVDRRE